MDIKRFDVSRTASLCVADTGKFKINDLWLSFTSPLSREKSALNALLPLVLSRGTGKLPDMSSLSRRLDDLYASVVSPRSSKLAETQFFGFFASMLDNSFAIDGCDVAGGTLEVLRDLVADPTTYGGVFRPEYVEGEKTTLKNMIASEINNKRRYAATRCIEEMCREEPFGISDSQMLCEIDKITPESLWEHYRKVLSGCRVEAFYVGRYSDRVAGLMPGLFEGIGSDGEQDYTPQIIRRADKVRRVVEDHPVRQGKLCMGYRTGTVLSDPDYYKFSVFNAVFGASPISKLFMNVREKLSLAYYCSSGVADGQKGIMTVNAGIDPASLEKTEDEIARQLAATAAGDITDSELEAAKAALVNSLREIEDLPSAVCRWYTIRMMAGRRDSPADNIERILSVKKDDVAEAASRVTLDTVYFMNPTLKEGEDEDDE